VLINHYSDGNKSRFANKLGVKPQTINTWLSRNTFDIELVYSKCEGLSAAWLLSGEGDMFTGSDNTSAVASGDGSVAAINSSVSHGNEAMLQERIVLLEKLLEEKERTIQLLLKQVQANYPQ